MYIMLISTEFVKPSDVCDFVYLLLSCLHVDVFMFTQFVCTLTVLGLCEPVRVDILGD